MDEKKKIRSWLVSYDGPARGGLGTGDIIYNTGPEGMTAEHIAVIRAHVTSPAGGDFLRCRISFFAELGA